MSQGERLKPLNNTAIRQLKSLLDAAPKAVEVVILGKTPKV
jgi:hypothetical protein